MSRARLFCSYSTSDEAYYAELEVHLAGLKRSECIETYSQYKIRPGDAARERILEALEDADIVLLLISANFIDSASCFDVEMKRALELEQAHQVLVIPVLLRDCDWQSMPFARLQMLPEDGCPIASRPESKRDTAWADVARNIRTHLGRDVPSEPTFEGSPEDPLDILVLRLLQSWPAWEFSAARMRHWGARRPGFEKLAMAGAHQLDDVLAALTEHGLLDTLPSQTGVQLYRASAKLQRRSSIRQFFGHGRRKALVYGVVVLMLLSLPVLLAAGIPGNWLQVQPGSSRTTSVTSSASLIPDPGAKALPATGHDSRPTASGEPIPAADAEPVPSPRRNGLSEPPAASPPPPSGKSVSVWGTIVTHGTNTPINNAQVILVGTNCGGRSNALGYFTIHDCQATVKAPLSHPRLRIGVSKTFWCECAVVLDVANDVSVDPDKVTAKEPSCCWSPPAVPTKSVGSPLHDFLQR